MTMTITPDTAAMLSYIMKDDFLHAKWLNTLSYLENCGARKIARYEHPNYVKEEVLKHASEEFRHAHHLKKQIAKLGITNLDTYVPAQMLGSLDTLRYLDKLELYTCRFLKTLPEMDLYALRHATYLLVTYAIEKRAAILYPVYHKAIKENGSNVSVSSILLEEKEHLEEMERELSKMPSGFHYAQIICDLEEGIFSKWLQTLFSELNALVR